MSHHHPIFLLFKLGTRGAIAAVLLLTIANPVTWGVGLALFDHWTGGNAGARFLGHAEPMQGACNVFVNGHRFVMATDYKSVRFPGKQVPT